MFFCCVQEWHGRVGHLSVLHYWTLAEIASPLVTIKDSYCAVRFMIGEVLSDPLLVNTIVLISLSQ